MLRSVITPVLVLQQMFPSCDLHIFLALHVTACIVHTVLAFLAGFGVGCDGGVGAVPLSRFHVHGNHSDALRLELAPYNPAVLVDVQAAVVVCFVWTALAHLAYATEAAVLLTGAHRGGSLSHLGALRTGHFSCWRWVEYSVSATLMILVIYALSGIQVLSSYVLAAAVNVAMIFMGAQAEFLGWRRGNFASLTLLLAAILCLPVCWAPVFMVTAAAMPTSVRWMQITVFLAFASFGVVYLIGLCLRRRVHAAPGIGVPRDTSYVIMEILYVTLSLVSKTLMAYWALCAITFKPQFTIP